MEREDFDALARRFAAASSRRSALGLLLGAGATVFLDAAEAKRRHKKDNSRKRNEVGKEAVKCEPPRASANLKGCDYANRDLAETDLSSSTLTGANFLRADLCGADLSSSQLANADLRGANLTLADLHSSGCRGVRVNADTTWCRTVDCNGTLRNDDCLGLGAEEICCSASDCTDPAKPICDRNRCVSCSATTCPNGCCRNGRCTAECPLCEICTDGQCVAKACGACEECNANGDCESTCALCEECSGGQCVAKTCGACEDCNAATGGCESICQSNETCCGGACTDTQTDSSNCGECGEACSAGYVCDEGTCRSTCTGPACVCPAGATACDWFSQASPSCSNGCNCAERADGSGSTCFGNGINCSFFFPCVTDADCAQIYPGQGLVCIRKGSCQALAACAGSGVCAAPCR